MVRLIDCLQFNIPCNQEGTHLYVETSPLPLKRINRRIFVGINDKQGVFGAYCYRLICMKHTGTIIKVNTGIST